MGLLGILFRAGREKAQEHSLKRDLEQKLGHKVSNEEMYSLGSHLDAAGDDSQHKPLNYTPRESNTPFADAKPPSKYRKYIILAGVLILIVGGFGLYVMSMSEYEYNRLNPFTPKPPADAYPAQIGKFTRLAEPEYSRKFYSSDIGPKFDAKYRTDGAPEIRYTLWNFNSVEELQKAFETKKKEFKTEKGYQIVDDSNSRFAPVWLKGGSTSVFWVDGTQLKELSNGPQKEIYELEGLLKNTAPVAVADVQLDNSITVTDLLNEFKKDETAAEKKYKDKTITITGAAEFEQKDKKGNPTVAFLKPGAKNPLDGMVICTFDKSQESSVSGIKKGDNIKLTGRFDASLIGNVVLEDCKKL